MAWMWSNLRVGIVGLALVATAGARALAQEVAVESPPPAAPTAPAPGVLADARLAEVRERVAAAAHAAAEAGLPAEWILDKIAEGLAKGVPPGQIVSAAERLGERMRTAARIQRDVPRARDAAASKATLHALVDALSVGAPEAAVAHLVRKVARADPDAVDAGIVAVADLGERGFRGEGAVHAAEVAFERGGRDGWTGLVQSADAIGPGASESRVRALDAAANRIGTPSSGPSLGLARGHASIDHPSGPPRDHANGRGRSQRRGPKN